MLRIKSLRQRLLFFVLIPLAILLVVMGVVGFFYAREKLQEQWSESVTLRLQQTAHSVDMRLERPKQVIDLYNQFVGTSLGDAVREAVLAWLKEMDGVVGVRLVGPDGSGVGTAPSPMAGGGMGMGRGAGTGHSPFGMMRVSPPRFSPTIKGRVVTLVSTVDTAADRIEVDIRFAYLIKNLSALGSWRGSTVIIVDQDGEVLNPKDLGDWPAPDDGWDLKTSTLEAMQQNPFGTVFRPDNPSRIMGGYYRLEQAPWTLVMFAPGEEVLSDLLDFRVYYIGVVAGFSVLILIIVRLVTGRTIASIKTVSRAAKQLARGRFGPPLPVRSDDEVGELTRSFNTMVGQLQDRMRIKKTLDLAMEVQLSLLPHFTPVIEGVDVAGKSIYCDETGGDYFDYISRGRGDNPKWVLLLGDVSDHGLPSALLMTTARAFLRQRVQQPGRPAEVLNDVNRLLAEDTAESGSFMTLFCLEIDPVEKIISWAVAGHEPAILYNENDGSFDELGGRGTALGLMEDYHYQDYSRNLGPDRIIVIGTDGIWETRNPKGEQFGKNRLRDVIAKNHGRTSQEILAAVVNAVERFRGSADVRDDLTLIVVKTST